MPNYRHAIIPLSVKSTVSFENIETFCNYMLNLRFRRFLRTFLATMLGTIVSVIKLLNKIMRISTILKYK